MRQIKIPDVVTIELESGDSRSAKFQVSFFKFMEVQLDGYGENEKRTPVQMRQVNKVLDRVSAATDMLNLEDADFDLVKAACKVSQFVPRVGRKLLAFFDAIEAAQEVKV